MHINYKIPLHVDWQENLDKIFGIFAANQEGFVLYVFVSINLNSWCQYVSYSHFHFFPFIIC